MRFPPEAVDRIIPDLISCARHRRAMRETLRNIMRNTEGRFGWCDVVLPAAYWAAADCHDGQGCEVYALFWTVGQHYRPSPLHRTAADHSEAAGKAYAAFCLHILGRNP